jgi:pimeloyl-ACP methyl ester carboxylesterase
LWAIRSNDLAWRQFRLNGNFNSNLYGPSNGNWIAVSGEGDTPHRPVNVPTAPFPQFDIPVPVKFGPTSSNLFLMTRFMIATKESYLTPTITNTAPAPPPIPTVAGRLTMPSDTPTAAQIADLRRKNVIIYIHGGGSRLEEAVPLAWQFLINSNSNFGTWSDNLAVISFDLPNSAYDDTWLASDLSARNPVTALDASSTFLEGGTNGTGPEFVLSFPVLNFTLNFINNFIGEMVEKHYLNPGQVIAVMGGSLGGNTSLLLSMEPMPAPFHLDRPLQFFAPQSAPGGGQPTIVAWSPTSMIAPPPASTVIGGNMCCLPLGGPQPGWESETPETRAKYFYNLYFNDVFWMGGVRPDPEMWYRSDWNGTPSLITQSRLDRYEIYSPLARLWTTAIDTEQAVFSFQSSTDSGSFEPYYNRISARLLLAAGACDDYDNDDNTAAPTPPPQISIGSCNGIGLGDTGSNALTSVDIYGFTHDVANGIRHAAGKTLFINDTGHSIHDERPGFFAQQIFNFLTNPDSNINLTLITDGDDLRWNSEAHALIVYDSNIQVEAHTQPATSIPPATGVQPATSIQPANSVQPANSIQPPAASLDIPLNYWFHPWPEAALHSPDNPCGACAKLTSFHFPSIMTINNFIIAMPSGSVPWINTFQIEFIAGTASVGNTTDEWKLGAVAACLPGNNGGFIADGFPPTGVVQDFKPSSDNQPIRWQPPSFQSPSASSLPNNCNWMVTNVPPSGVVPKGFWSDGIQLSN